MDDKKNLAFKKINYVIMLVGIGFLALGFIVMASDGEEFGFGAAGLTIGPIIVLFGFIVELFAIMYQPKNKQ
ncbi:DUF3098 domain-containing protein [Cytophagaceae bacterium ABcell3]|nr:DUF3098 domain-containing protein [Cytophagaceae bacterium ABcell3]